VKFVFQTAPARGRRPAILLDRDGVINERIEGGYVTNWAEFRFLDGIVPVLRTLSQLHLPMIVVSNQAGVGKGLMGQRSLRQITTRFVELLARHGARIDAVYYCPHTDEQACSCRKPKPGLLLRAARDWQIDLSRSVLVGDSQSDIDAATAAGCRGVLLDHGGEELSFNAARRKGTETEAGAPGVIKVRKVSDLPAQVTAMLGRFVLY
jgi:D-glycero-D-manno-heptose 1,7-bisphosphate phosphatase